MTIVSIGDVRANAKKSGVMIVGGADDGHNDVMPYCLKGEVVPIVSTYKKLGIVFNNTRSWSAQLEYVLSRATKAVDDLEFRFWKNRSVDIESKVISWKRVPAIEYGSEIWWTGMLAEVGDFTTQGMQMDFGMLSHDDERMCTGGSWAISTGKPVHPSASSVGTHFAGYSR